MDQQKPPLTNWKFCYRDRRDGSENEGRVSVRTRRELDSKVMAVYGDIIDWTIGVTLIREVF